MKLVVILLSCLITLQQEANAASWERRELLVSKLAAEQQKRNAETMKEIITKLASLQTRGISEELRSKLSKRDQHGSAGLWGKRNADNLPYENAQRLQQFYEESGVRDMPDQSNRIGYVQRRSRQPEDIGLWGVKRLRKRNMANAQEMLEKRFVLRGLYQEPEMQEAKKSVKFLRRRSRQPDDIGLWRGKRGEKLLDPSKGQNGGENVGLWGKRSKPNNAGLWGRKRSMESKETIYNKYNKVF